MDKLADRGRHRPGRDPQSATACARARRAPTGQVIDSAAPVAELLQRLAGDAAAARRRTAAAPTCAGCPAGSSNTTHGEGVAAASATRWPTRTSASPRASTTTPPPGCGSRSSAGEPVATVHTAAAEVGQGLVTVEQQICRTELGVDRVVVAPQGHPGRLGRLDARRRGRPTSPAARSRRPARAVRGRVLASRPPQLGRAGRPSCGWTAARSSADAGEVVIGLADLLGDDAVEETVEWRHRPTEPIDPETGQGYAHVQYAFAAHRAVVDVDVELGLVKVVELGTAPRTSAGRSTRRPWSARSRAAAPRAWAWR